MPGLDVLDLNVPAGIEVPALRLTEDVIDEVPVGLELQEDALVGPQCMGDDDVAIRSIRMVYFPDGLPGLSHAQAAAPLPSWVSGKRMGLASGLSCIPLTRSLTSMTMRKPAMAKPIRSTKSTVQSGSPDVCGVW